MAESLVGDIIEIEHTDDHTATTPQWDLVGKTKDTVEVSPNTEVAEVRHHGQYAMDKAPVSESWEIGFSTDIVTGTAQLQTLGLINETTQELKGSADSREGGGTAEAIRITVYATEEDAAAGAGSEKYQLATPDYIIAVDTGEIGVEDFSTREIVVHSRVRPIRLDAGGSL